MRTTAILNLKGGVGKTTTVINMAAVLARHHGKRVLVIDADSQCNTTVFFGGQKAKLNLADLLRSSEIYRSYDTLADLDVIGQSKYPGIDLLAADDSLMDLDLTKVEQRTIRAEILRDLVCVVSANYDCTLIDCPPAFNAACVAALVSADDVIIPMKLDAFSLQGMANLTRQVMNLNKINQKLKIAGLLPTMWYKDPQSREAETTLVDAGFHLFPHIRLSRKVDDMTWMQSHLGVYSPKSAAWVDYKRFVKAYLGGGSDGV